jgi:phosphopantothenoylcysteine decarboxylase/phosphopantothenate--cysteine ligase
MDHISLSRWADLILIAPATANTISKLANGNSDDLASTVALASNKKIFIAPAMNVRMWNHQSTKQNIDTLKTYDYRLIGPEIGDMACGEYGEGKMSEPKEIINELESYFENLKINNKLKAIVTAGPTNEYIDPIRFITNKSSGKQGYEIAKSFFKKGFDTTLISGPTNLEINDGINIIKVETAEEMFQATLNNLPADVAVFTAAVGDYKAKEISQIKIKKQDRLKIELEKNVDILNYISNHNSLRPELVVGFAAETNNLEDYAKKKLNEKNCDWIVANDISNKKIGFDSDFNEVSIFYKNSKTDNIKYKSKSEVSDELVKKIINHLN